MHSQFMGAKQINHKSALGYLKSVHFIHEESVNNQSSKKEGGMRISPEKKSQLIIHSGTNGYVDFSGRPMTFDKKISG